MTTWSRQLYENDYFAIAKGESNGQSFIHKNGYNFDIDATTDPETIWTVGGLYPWSEFNSSRTIYVQSTSALENGQVLIDGLDDNFNVIQEYLPVVGTATSVSTLSYKRVNAMIFVDGDQTNIGTVSARVGSSAGVVVAEIFTGFGITSSATYTVPAGFTAYILCGDFTVKKGEGAQVQFKVRAFGSSFRTSHIAEAYQASYRYDFLIPLPIPEKSDLDVLVYQVESNNTRVSSNFDLILVDNLYKKT